MSKQILTSPSIQVPPAFMPMSCGGCGATHFTVIVQIKNTLQAETPEVFGFECCQCRNRIRVDDQSRLQGAGQFQPGKEKEHAS